jgi:hypothetical protein
VKVSCPFQEFLSPGCRTARLVAVFEFEFGFGFGQGRGRVRLRPDHGATAGCSPTAEGRDGARPAHPLTAEGSKPLKIAKQG